MTFSNRHTALSLCFEHDLRANASRFDFALTRCNVAKLWHANANFILDLAKATRDEFSLLLFAIVL